MSRNGGGADTPLDEALDELEGPTGTVEVDTGSGQAEVDVVDVDRLGVRIRGVRVRREKEVDVKREAAALPERLRALPDRVQPVEVAPELGGARLRSPPDRRQEYFEVDVAPDGTDIRRTRVDSDGERHPVDWTMTRDQLDRLIDEASDEPDDG
ncbi:MAG: hypothetical protein KTR31_04660 [Myxococcales bacterium]|nr:hypothetical protein [Myxococcales bacterium]